MKTKFLLLLLLIPLLIIPVFALPAGVPFDEFCQHNTSNEKTTAADFICELDIFQMKNDIETLNNRIALLEEKPYFYYVIVNGTAQPDQATQVTALCNTGDYQLFRASEINSYPVGHTAAFDNIQGSWGNADAYGLIGSSMILHNYNSETDLPVEGDLTILCLKRSIP